MLFNSLQYVLYLPVVFIIYWLLQRRLWWQNLFIVAASYVFYGWWDWRFLLLIVFTSLCSYGSGVALAHSHTAGVRRGVTAANIVVNLLVLGIFKYFNFFVDNMSVVLRAMGFTPDVPTLHVILPVGISFYTFQALSYTIDVYRGKLEPTRDVVAFLAYISFFPQLVAGPIERATRLLPQMLRKRHFDYGLAVDGMRQMLWGYVKKVVVADTCATVVDTVWADVSGHNWISLLVAALLFAIQIYGDFSGYSDIAIGTARLFGIDLMRNFDVPYFSRNVIEFWRRWHISLMTWLRDYVYIPLGGNRCPRWRVIANTLAVFLVSGLWHGANWTYVCWGIYHALLFVPFMLLGVKASRTVVAQGRLLPRWGELGSMLLTFALVVIGWVLFRAPTMGAAMGFLRRLFTAASGQSMPTSTVAIPMLVSVVMLATEWLTRDRQHALQLAGTGLMHYRICRWAVYYALLMAVVVFYASRSAQPAFIYFQF